MATLILKATEACNSNCAYCDVVHKTRRGPATMSPEVLDRVFFRIGELLRDAPDEELEIVWHGGEPLLAGVDFYERAAELQGRYCADAGARRGGSAVATLILKATEACNSNCAYCDVVHKARRGPATMSPEVLDRVFFRIGELLSDAPDEELEIVWHGGEPLLAGVDFYERAAELQGRYCADTSARIQHSVQTNLSLFDRDFARVFRALGMDCVGTSYDPIAGIRGPGAEHDSAAYNSRFMRGLRVAEEEGFGWGVIYVVTKAALARP